MISPLKWIRTLLLILSALFVGACAHYPVNPPVGKKIPQKGLRVRDMEMRERSSGLLMILSFSGGGTRAAAFSYGVLEKLAETEAVINGEKSRLLDEIDLISGVSGGSFTAAYFGLFGDRIFEDFEERFLKKNVQGVLIGKTVNPLNWFRLWSPTFARSDLAAEYYDKNIFDGGTFGDIFSRGGPMIVINATDMTQGNQFPFIQNSFDLICADLHSFPVARAVAASSAVPFLLSPITIKNYSGSCDFEEPKAVVEALKERARYTRRYHRARVISSYFDTTDKPYIHLVDGGISDNLGLRAAIDRITILGDMWSTLKNIEQENTHQIAFIVVNAETSVDNSLDKKGSTPSNREALKSATNIQISRYNYETVELLKEKFVDWAGDIRKGRCKEAGDAKEGGLKSGARCSEIEFYLIKVDFDALPDESEREYFKNLPTSFTLPDETVDKLTGAAKRVLADSPEFKRLLNDIRGGP